MQLCVVLFGFTSACGRCFRHFLNIPSILYRFFFFLLLVLPNEIFEIFHYLLTTHICVVGTSSRYTTKTPLILLQIQPTPHFKIHKDVIRLLIVSRPPSDNFNDRDTSFRTSRKTENTKSGLFYTFYRLPSTKRRQ